MVPVVLDGSRDWTCEQFESRAEINFLPAVGYLVVLFFILISPFSILADGYPNRLNNGCICIDTDDHFHVWSSYIDPSLFCLAPNFLLIPNNGRIYLSMLSFFYEIKKEVASSLLGSWSLWF